MIGGGLYNGPQANRPRPHPRPSSPRPSSPAPSQPPSPGEEGDQQGSSNRVPLSRGGGWRGGGRGVRGEGPRRGRSEAKVTPDGASYPEDAASGEPFTPEVTLASKSPFSGLLSMAPPLLPGSGGHGFTLLPRQAVSPRGPPGEAGLPGPASLPSHLTAHRRECNNLG